MFVGQVLGHDGAECGGVAAAGPGAAQPRQHQLEEQLHRAHSGARHMNTVRGEQSAARNVITYVQ